MSDLKSVQEILNAVLSANGTQLAVSGGGGGGGAGIGNLSAASDVSITSPVIGNKLTYSGTAWTNTFNLEANPFADKYNAYIKRVILNASQGFNSVYTCPSGKKAQLYSNNCLVHNPTATAFTYTLSSCIAGTNRKIKTATSIAASTSDTFGSYINPLVLSASDTFAVCCVSAGMNFNFDILEFDADSPIKRVFVAPLSSGGYTTLYTCPSGYWAMIGNPETITLTSSQTATTFTTTSAAFSAFVHLVPDSVSVATNNRFYKDSINGSDTPDVLIVPKLLSAGDRLIISCDTALNLSASYLFFNVLEYPT